jgi:hypothetical protein
MIEHGLARRLAAAAIDGPLGGADAGRLEDHLAGCAACRTAAGALRLDARALADLPRLAVPTTLRPRVLEAIEAGAGGGGIGWLRVGLVAAIMALTLWGTALLGVGALRGDPAEDGLDGGAGLTWQSEVVRVRADSIAVTAAGRAFPFGGARAIVESDPGTLSSWSLEASWLVGETPMRLTFSFTAEGGAWRVFEARAYDGTPAGEWTTLVGVLPSGRLGEPWTGDLDLTGAGPDGGVRVLMPDAVIEVAPRDSAARPPGPAIVLPENATPFAPGGPLHCSGILQLPPWAAHARLLALGYAVSWRAVYESGPITSYWDPRTTPPDGIIPAWDSPGVGTDGAIIIAVVPFTERNLPEPATFPSDCVPPAD